MRVCFVKICSLEICRTLKILKIYLHSINTWRVHRRKDNNLKLRKNKKYCINILYIILIWTHYYHTVKFSWVHILSAKDKSPWIVFIDIIFERNKHKKSKISSIKPILKYQMVWDYLFSKINSRSKNFHSNVVCFLNYLFIGNIFIGKYNIVFLEWQWLDLKDILISGMSFCILLLCHFKCLMF